MLNKYDEYIEELLLAQYNVSEIIEHMLTRGEIREDFIKDQIIKQFPHIKCCKGVITSASGNEQSGQLDIIIPKEGARERCLGAQHLFSCEDVSLVLEVKSAATGTHFRELNDEAKRIKSFESSSYPRFGLICYNYNLTKKNLLKRFGYTYDSEIMSFEYSDQLRHEYPNIDFVLALEKDEENGYSKCFFITKDVEGEYYLNLSEPVSKHFFKLVGSR